MNDDKVPIPIQDFVRTTKHFNIDRYSPKGGFGQLYFGTRNTLKDRVALKFYDIRNKHNPHEEAQILLNVKHKNILEIFDARMLDNSFAYFVTPEISGGDLQIFIEKNNVDLNTALSIITEILQGLSELHKSPNNLLHRDLKPGNILINRHNQHVFIGDFGSIKKIPDNSDFVSASEYSFFYRPKEAIENNKFYGQSDIYQVGIILYQMLGGFFPINDNLEFISEKKRMRLLKLNADDRLKYYEQEIQNLICSGKILKFDTLPIYIDRNLRRIIKKATAPNYLDRYKNCALFEKDLYDYQKKSKNWSINNGNIYSVNKKKTKFYQVLKQGKKYVLKISPNGINFREKNAGNTLSQIIDFIQKDNS